MLSFLLILITALFFTGIIGRAKSIFAGRKGPGILQPLKNVVLLLRKGSVFSTSSSVVLQIAPVIAFASVFTAALLVPFGQQGAMINVNYNFVLFAYLLGVGRFFMIVGALDTASSFEGMGANREAWYGLLLEPAFFIIMASFALLTGSFSFESMFSGIQQSEIQFVLIAVIAVFVFFNISLVENSRIPVDDPKTHLELTMIHEVMVLDNSGFDLAMVQMASFLKFAIFGTLISNCLIPANLNLWSQIAMYAGIQVVFAISIGFVESFRARNRMNKNAQYILAISAIALIGLMVALILRKPFL